MDLSAMPRQAVITGIGIVSPIGIGREPFWSALSEGKSGFRPITLFDASAYSVQHAGEITDFDPVPYLGKKGLRDLDRATKLLCVASMLAIEDSGLSLTAENRGKTGISVAATFGSLRSFAEFDRSGLVDGPRYVNPSLFPNTVINSPASRVAIRLGISGFNTTLSTGFCAGLDAASCGADFLGLGRADTVLAGATEELCEETLRIFHSQGMLAEDIGTEAACLPFSPRSQGTVCSEAAAAIVMEEMRHASLRDATVLAKMRGWGSSFDPMQDLAYRSHDGLVRAIVQALSFSSLSPDEIDFVVSGANAVQGCDRIEAAAIREVFGRRGRELPITSVKAAAGETYSASGMLSLAAAALSLKHSVVVPLPLIDTPDDEYMIDIVRGEPRQGSFRFALVTASDPLGNNTAVVLERADG